MKSNIFLFASIMYVLLAVIYVIIGAIQQEYNFIIMGLLCLLIADRCFVRGKS